MPTAATIEGALIARLLTGLDWQGNDLGDASVPSLVGPRIHPVGDPQPVARPKLTYQRIDTDRSAASGGLTNDGPTGMAIARIQWNCLADTLIEAKQLATAVRRSLNGLAGTLSGIQVGQVRIDSEREDPTSIDPGQERAPQRISLDARVVFTEAV